MKRQDIQAICLILLIPFCIPTSLSAQSRSATVWTDSVMATMSLDEKIGQLFILTAYSNQDESDYQYLQRMVERYHPGGLIFMQGTPEKQVELITNSSSSNDSPFVSASYEVSREDLLDKGVMLLEYKDQALNDDHYYHVDTYYHNKTIIIDRRLTYIGSSNFSNSGIKYSFSPFFTNKGTDFNSLKTLDNIVSYSSSELIVTS